MRKLMLIADANTRFFINIQGDSKEHRALYKNVRNNLNNAYVLTTPNKGRDIGAKLMLMDLLFRLDFPSDYTLIIHDKKSPHLENGDYWREELFKIIDPKYISQVFETFEKERAGIVGSVKYIQNEYDASGTFACNCNDKIKELLKKYNIQTSNYDFVAGNIFWIRTDLLKSFFIERPILQIRSDLESGNALDFSNGTYIHSWERLMSWIATSQGYSIYGI